MEISLENLYVDIGAQRVKKYPLDSDSSRCNIVEKVDNAMRQIKHYPGPSCSKVG